MQQQTTSSPTGQTGTSTAGHGARRQPRASVKLPVRISGAWGDGGGAFVPVLARSVNVSEGGMTLSAPLLLPAGCDVTCSVRVGGQLLYLQGHVAWRHRDDAHGGRKLMGIRFDDTSEQDLSALRRRISVATGRVPVAVRFDGMDAPVAALADEDDAGLHLSTALPLLRRGSKVSFVLSGQDTPYRGALSDVRLDARSDIPVLHARVDVDGEQRPDYRQRVRRIGMRRRRLWQGRLLHVLTGLCGLAIGAGYAVHDQAGVGAGIAAVAPGADVATFAQGAGISTAATAAPPPAEQRPTTRKPTGPTAAAEAKQHGAVHTAAPAAVGPAVSVDRRGRHVRVPVHGAATRIEHIYRLARPPGVAVQLSPQPKLAPGKYPLNRQGLLWLRVRERASSGSQVGSQVGSQAPDTRPGAEVRLFAQDTPEEFGVDVHGDDLHFVLPHSTPRQ